MYTLYGVPFLSNCIHSRVCAATFESLVESSSIVEMVLELQWKEVPQEWTADPVEKTNTKELASSQNTFIIITAKGLAGLQTRLELHKRSTFVRTAGMCL